MKVIFNPQQFLVPEGTGNISVEGAFQGLGIDFLAVMALLYEMPFLWFSEGIFVGLDFDSEMLILKVPEDKGEDFHAKEVVQEIPLVHLITKSISTIRERYIRPFAANLAEYNFRMPKTAAAIREYRPQSVIMELAFEEGHPVLDTEITNLLFRESWEMTTSYEESNEKKSLSSSFFYFIRNQQNLPFNGLVELTNSLRFRLRAIGEPEESYNLNTQAETLYAARMSATIKKAE